MSNKPNNNSSIFNNLFGISRDWEEISITFASLLQKEMIENMKGSSNFSSPEKISLYSEEWKKVWKKIENKIHEATTKNKNDFTSSPSSASKAHPFHKNWEEFWKKVMRETQKSLDKNRKKFGYSPFPPRENSSSGPENLLKMVSENMEKAAKKMEALESLKKNYVEDFQELFQSNVNNIHEKTRKAYSNPRSVREFSEDVLGQNNPAFSSFQKLYRLNTKFLKESMKI